MDSAFTYTSAHQAEAAEWTAFQLQSWGVRTPYVKHFLNEATGLLGPDRTGRVVLDYDAPQRLLSMDVWCGPDRLYGMDDLV